MLGNIGTNRLEYTVIGETVNVASRLEALTRDLGVALAVSDSLVRQLDGEPDRQGLALDKLERTGPQRIRGLAEPINLWTRAGGRGEPRTD